MVSIKLIERTEKLLSFLFNGFYEILQNNVDQALMD